MYLGYHEEGDKCPECKDGILDWEERKTSCSCHINPPCSACTDRRLKCNKCGWLEERLDYKDVPVVPGLAMREFAPRPLDNTKIDYRVKGHTGASQICEGVYPEGTTPHEVTMLLSNEY